MYIKINGYNINYKIINEDLISQGRTLLVFFHEGLGSILQWKSFPDLLSNKMNMPALVYDRIGYGNSDFWTDREIKSKFLHNEALNIFPAIIKELKITNDIVLFGHSDGGTIALIHASNPLPQVKAAIIEAPHVFLEEFSLNGIRNARKILDNEKIIRLMDRYQQGRAAELIDKWTVHWLKANTDDWDAVGILKRISIPLLLMQGDKDDFGTFAQIDNVANSVLSEIVEVHKIDDCGHIPHLQKQEIIMEFASEFINRIDN